MSVPEKKAWRPRALGALVVRRPRLVLVLSLAVTLAAVLPSLRLRLETDLAALLPRDAPASAEYLDFLETFGGFEKVFVVAQARGAEPADPGDLAAAAESLAAALAGSPAVAGARSGLTPADEEFFFRYVALRAPLLLPGADWRTEVARRLDPAAIRGRVAEMRQSLRSPLGSFAAPLFTADPLGLSERLLVGARSALPVDPLTGAFLSRDQDSALVVVTPARAEIDPEGGRALLAALERAGAKAARESGLDLDLTPLGGPVYAAQDEAILRADLTRICIASAVSVTAVLLLGFEGLLLPAALGAAVAAGVAWTAGIAGLWLGGLTVVAVGFIASLFGMGVEYGIHGGARYRQLLLAGSGRPAALEGAFRETGPGIVSSALTTAVALGALANAHFRPLSEMGIVLTVGVLAILVTTATVGAPFLALAPERASRRLAAPGKTLWRRFWGPLFDGLAGFAARRPGTVLAGALLLSAAAAWGLPSLALQADLRSLRPEDHPSAAAERLVVEEFGLGLDTSTVVVRGRSLEEALARAARVRGVLQEALGPAADVTSPSDWMGGGGALERRLAELRRLPFAAAADALEGELAAAGFRVERFERALAALRAFGRGEDPGAPPPSAWPEGMAELVRAAPGGGTAAAVHVRVPLGAWPEGPPAAVMAALRRAAPGASVASVSRVGAELRDLALTDLRRSSIVAAVLVALVVIVSLRGALAESLLASLPLALGCLWTFGFWGLAGRGIDLLSIATLPVLLGTGIDLGVHAVHGARHDPRGLEGAVARSGFAMTLVVLTTGAGFASLGSSRVPGLQNAGVLVAVGVIACLVATLLVLPALGALRQPRERGGDGEQGIQG